MESLLVGVVISVIRIGIFGVLFGKGFLTNKSKIEWFLRYGKCYDCGAFSSRKTYLSVRNQDYHDSPLDIYCSLYCICHSKTDNVFTHYYYNNPKDKEFYGLAIAYNTKTISWYKEWKEKGDKERLEASLKQQKEREIAKSFGL